MDNERMMFIQDDDCHWYLIPTSTHPIFRQLEEADEYDGHLVVNAHTGCGETMTYFFNLSKEVKF